MTWARPPDLRFGQGAAARAQAEHVGRGEAGRDVVGLLGVVDALADGHLAALVDLARVVHGAGLTAPVSRCVDGDDPAGGGVGPPGAGSAADGVAGGGVADRVLPGPVA